MDAMRPSPRLITVFGGSGFLGRHVVRALARRGYRIRVAVRRPDLAFYLQPLGTVGQIEAVQANLRYDESVARAVVRADAVVNLAGILRESGRQTFDEVQAEGARSVAQAARGLPVVHVSASGANGRSRSAYARAKRAGERAVLEAQPEAVILRPSVMFGQGDSFFNRFGALARALPVIPLAGAGTRFQPVFVGDVAEAVARAVDGKLRGGQIYELGGPEVRTLREIVSYVLAVTGRNRPIIAMPEALARIMAFKTELASSLSLGLFPNDFVITRDQLKLLATDNVVSDEAKAEGRTLEGIGITPDAMEAVVPDYLERFRKTGQFNLERA